MKPERDDGADPPPAAAAERPGSRRLVLARRIVLLSVGCFPFFCVALPLFGLVSASGGDRLSSWSLRLGGWPSAMLTAGVVVASLATGYLTWRIIRSRIDRHIPATGRHIILSGVTATGASLLISPNPYGVSVMFLWAACVSVVMGKKRSALALLYGLVVSFVPFLIAVGYDGSLVSTVVAFLAAAIMVVVWLIFAGSAHGLIVLWDIINEAYAGRDAQARLAVTEERLRFARDLHDLIGHSLSRIAVKSELAARLVEHAPETAVEEMRAVQSSARAALREVRSAVSGYRDVDLEEEIASMRAVLTAAGVRCTVTSTDGELPAELRSAAAAVVREGVTNVLRHSAAKQCGIVLRGEDDAVLIEVYNDGSTTGGRAVRFGNGLVGLTERVAAVGGTLSASPSAPDGFLLRAVLPARPPGSTQPDRQPPSLVQGKDVKV